MGDDHSGQSSAGGDREIQVGRGIKRSVGYNSEFSFGVVVDVEDQRPIFGINRRSGLSRLQKLDDTLNREDH